MTLTKSSIAAWFALHRGYQLLQVGRRRLELREIARELVERQRLLVALPLVAGEGVLVAEGVADPESLELAAWALLGGDRFDDELWAVGGLHRRGS